MGWVFKPCRKPTTITQKTTFNPGVLNKNLPENKHKKPTHDGSWPQSYRISSTTHLIPSWWQMPAEYKLCVTEVLGGAYINNPPPLGDVYVLCNINTFQTRLQLQLQLYTFIHMFVHLPIPLTNIYNTCQPSRTLARTQSDKPITELCNHFCIVSTHVWLLAPTTTTTSNLHSCKELIYHHRVKLSQMINKALYTDREQWESPLATLLAKLLMI